MKEALGYLMETAISKGASDIHMTIENHRCTYELRIDGILSVMKVKKELEDERLFQYLKFIAHCELADASRPQTGSFVYDNGKKTYACRFAVMSTRYRMVGVIRILDRSMMIPLNHLTPDNAIRMIFEKIILLHHGLIILSGATGSGKTTSAYSLLNAMKSRKIYTIEDPIEIYYPNLMQVQINEAAHMDYGDAIKQIMRHDPDVIFIGEIRDETAAAMALRAALTGHLVLATLHAGSAVSAYHRLLDLGVDSQSLQDSLAYLCYQQLLVDPRTRVKFTIVEAMDHDALMQYVRFHKICYETVETKIGRLQGSALVVN